jgi:hypothetical protein
MKLTFLFSFHVWVRTWCTCLSVSGLLHLAQCPPEYVYTLHFLYLYPWWKHGWFYTLTVVNSAARHWRMQVSPWHADVISFGYKPSSRRGEWYPTSIFGLLREKSFLRSWDYRHAPLCLACWETVSMTIRNICIWLSFFVCVCSYLVLESE